MRKTAVKMGAVKKVRDEVNTGITEKAKTASVPEEIISKATDNMNKVADKATGSKETLGTSKKKRRLRDGRRSLISGSAMGVSDKLG